MFCVVKSKQYDSWSHCTIKVRNGPFNMFIVNSYTECFRGFIDFPFIIDWKKPNFINVIYKYVRLRFLFKPILGKHCRPRKNWEIKFKVTRYKVSILQLSYHFSFSSFLSAFCRCFVGNCDLVKLNDLSYSFFPFFFKLKIMIYFIFYFCCLL